MFCHRRKLCAYGLYSTCWLVAARSRDGFFASHMCRNHQFVKGHFNFPDFFSSFVFAAAITLFRGKKYQEIAYINSAIHFRLIRLLSCEAIEILIFSWVFGNDSRNNLYWENRNDVTNESQYPLQYTFDAIFTAKKSSRPFQSQPIRFRQPETTNQLSIIHYENIN